MATKPAVTYSGPRAFRGLAADALGEALDRTVAAIADSIQRLSGGGPRRWVFAPTLRGNGAILPNVAIPLDTVTATGNAITLTLAPPDPRDYGLECGILRLSATGTVTMSPINGASFNGATTSAAIPATAGFYVLVISPSGYWLRR